MPNRRDFFKTMASATAGAFVLDRGLAGSRIQAAQVPAGTRRQVSIDGRRVKVIDVHAHCAPAEVEAVVKGTPFASNGRPTGGRILGPESIRRIDQQGIDVQALGINGFWWYTVDRDLAARIVRAQNEGLARWCAQHPDRFVGLASVALQYPDLAAQQLEEGVKRLGLRGVGIGGHVNNESLSLPKYDPFWAKAAELGSLVFMHPVGGAENIVKEDAFEDVRGDLVNIMGNPLETAYFLSRLIFDGTLDKFPGLRICCAHGGGYLPSYLGRSDVACKVRPRARCANERTPSEYFKRELLVDTMVFSDEGLRHLVAEMGVSQIVYGTDNPLDWPPTLDLVLNASFLSSAEKEAILGGNLMKLLRIAG